MVINNEPGGVTFAMPGAIEGGTSRVDLPVAMVRESKPPYLHPKRVWVGSVSWGILLRLAGMRRGRSE